MESGDDVRELSSARRSKFPPNLSPQLAFKQVQAPANSSRNFGGKTTETKFPPYLSPLFRPSNSHYGIVQLRYCTFALN